MARFVCKADHWSISVGHVYNVRRFSTRDISDKRRPSAHEKCLPNRNRVTQVQSRRKHYLKSKIKKRKKRNHRLKLCINVLSTGIVFCIFCDRCIIIRIQYIYILCIKTTRLKLLFHIRRKNSEIFEIEFESTK